MRTYRATAVSRVGSASRAVEAIGGRYLLGTLCASVAVSSFEEGLQAAVAATPACGTLADHHLRNRLRPDRVELSLQTSGLAAVTGRDTALAHAVSAAVARVGATTPGPKRRPVQTLELAIDALDIPRIRPFWRPCWRWPTNPARPDQRTGW